jgi:vancomycin permeability regulator SanA
VEEPYTTATEDIFVIMGAAVWPEGVPSKAMRRRVQVAVDTARSSQASLFLPTGGLGRHPPVEAVAMRDLLLEKGIPESRILMESRSRSTLASVINCARIIQSLKAGGRVYICTDTYHQPRCLWLFRLMGIQAKFSPIPSGRSSTGLLRWFYFYCREVAAIPADSIYLLLFRYLSVRVAGVLP